MHKNITSLLLALVCCFVLYARADEAEPLANFPQSALTIATPDARIHRLKVWVADTDRHREQGLMFIKHLDEDAGMLFLYPNPRRIAMWMKNTYIPLDMVFIASDGRVAGVAKNTKPMSLDVIESQTDVVGVLELNAGTAQRLGIGPGALVQQQKGRD